MRRTIAIVLLIVFFLLQLLPSPSKGSSFAAFPSAYPSDLGGTCGSDLEELKSERREEYGEGRILDISHFYREDMPAWDSDHGLGRYLRLYKSMKNSSLANFSEVKMGTHSGTHVDAPGHYIQPYFDARFDIDTLDLAFLNGPALLVDVPRDKNITEFKPTKIYLE